MSLESQNNSQFDADVYIQNLNMEELKTNSFLQATFHQLTFNAPTGKVSLQALWPLKTEILNGMVNDLVRVIGNHKPDTDYTSEVPTEVPDNSQDYNYLRLECLLSIIAYRRVVEEQLLRLRKKEDLILQYEDYLDGKPVPRALFEKLEDMSVIEIQQELQILIDSLPD